MKKVFLDELPRWETDIRYNNTIKWKECIGYKIRFIYDDIEGWIEIVDYNSKSQVLTIKYNNKNFNIVAGNFSKCALGNLLNKKTSEFKIEIGTRFQDDKRDITIIDKKKIKDKNGVNRKYYKYVCNKCGFDCREHYSLKNKKYEENYWIVEYNLKKGQGCACCCNPPQIAIMGKNTIYDTDPWMIPIVGEEFAKSHTHSCSDAIYPICPDCGRIKPKKMKISTIYSNHSIGCICSDGKSYPEKIMIYILKQLNEDFDIEKYFKWCRFKNYKNNKITYGIYDFFIENKNLIIETDGDFHLKNNDMNGQTKEESIYIDKCKDKLAIENGYNIIRIECTTSELEFVKYNILNSNLNKLYNLSRIDWIKAEEFALNNLVKIASKYKRENPNMTTTEISKIIGVKKGTVCKWLKKANRVGWCYYNSKEEQVKNGRKNGRLSSKSVEIFKDGISLGIFESATEIERQSEKLFGIKLNHNGITRICRGERPHYKGYIFKFV